MILYAFNFLFVAVWITGIYSFVSLRETPSMQAREWRLRLFTNLYALIYITYMCFTFEDFFNSEASNFGPYCTYFTLMHLMLPPFISGSFFLMHYNLEFITRRLNRQLSGFFKIYYWTTRFDMTIILFLFYCLIYDIPNFSLITIAGIPSDPRSPTECYGHQVLLNAAQSVVAVFLVHSLRKYQLKSRDPYDVGLEMDVHNYSGMILFPVFHVPFIYQYYYKKDFGTFTPFHSHLIYVSIYHFSTIWVPIIQNNKREEANLARIQQVAGRLSLKDIIHDEFMAKRLKRFIESTKTKQGVMVELFREIEELKEVRHDSEEDLKELWNAEVPRIFELYLKDNPYLLPPAVLSELVQLIEANQVDQQIFDRAYDYLSESLTVLFGQWKSHPQFTTSLAQSDLLEVENPA